VTVIEEGDAAVTVSDAVPEIEPEVAVIVEPPGAIACASPLVGVVLLTFATLVLEELQFALPVRFCVLPSL
jgi:hypothetical protein